MNRHHMTTADVMGIDDAKQERGGAALRELGKRAIRYHEALEKGDRPAFDRAVLRLHQCASRFARIRRGEPV